MIETITAILKKEGYFDIKHEETTDEQVFFEAESDATVQIRVDLKGEKIEIYDRYVSEKHYVHQGTYQLSTGKEIK